MEQSIIQNVCIYNSNTLYIKREDLLPFSFGGNKARKAELFFDVIDRGGYDCVVTYGSGSSNHCRVIANQCAVRGMKCYIISPEEAAESTFNSQMMYMFGAEITVVPVKEVHDTIENKISGLKSQGYKPYFIAGGGHGNIGTQAYVNCYEEIKEFEKQNNVHFDYIFFASGTGTTQAGLVYGLLLNKDNRKIVGISIARKLPRGRDVVIDSIREYAKDNNEFGDDEIDAATIFVDKYTDGYGKQNAAVKEVINEVLCKYGIPLDETYTGKAFYGMKEYIKENNIEGKNILFIHTGGTPLFFDYLKGRLS